MPQKLSVGPFQFSSTGVRVVGKPELEAWKGPVQFAFWCQRAGPWWIGDMVNAGEDRFGEAFSQLGEGGVSTEMLSRYAAVARRVPIQNRLPGLSWSAHAMVARLPVERQRPVLERAEREGWDTTQIRDHVRELLKPAS